MIVRIRFIDFVSNTFWKKISELLDFKKIADQFVLIAENYSQQVDAQKMKAIGAQNLLKTIAKQRESEQQQIQSLIMEKSMELDRLKMEYQYLQRTESDQQEVIDNYYQNQ